LMGCRFVDIWFYECVTKPSTTEGTLIGSDDTFDEESKNRKI
jgi:hypothetical protein